MKITKIFLNSMLIMYKKNKLPFDRIQLMRQEVFERDFDSCKFCKHTKGDEICDKCCNNYETFFTPNKLFTGKDEDA